MNEDEKISFYEYCYKNKFFKAHTAEVFRVRGEEERKRRVRILRCCMINVRKSETTRFLISFNIYLQ